MKELRALAMEQKKMMTLLTGAVLIKGLAMVMQALFLVLVVDGIFMKGDGFSSIVPYLWGLAGAVLLRSASGYVIGRIGVSLSTQVQTNMRERLIHSFANDPLQASMEEQSGRKVGLLLDSVDEVDGFFRQFIPQMVQTAIIPSILLIVILTQHWATVLIILITAPFIPVFMALVGMRTKEKADAQMEQLSRFSGTFLDVLQGLPTLRLFGQSAKQKEQIRSSSLGFRDSTMDVLKSAFFSSLALEYISMLAMGIIALEIGIGLVVFDNVTFFTAFFVMVLVPDFFNSLKDYGSAFHTARGSLSAAERLTAALEKDTTPVAWGEREMTAGPKTMTLEQLSFSYGTDFAVKDFTATIEPGSQVAIVGKSGSGKTTLMHLIAGLLPTESGRIGIGGEDRRTLSEASWFRELAYISQNPYLFAGSIRDNMILGMDRRVEESELLAAAQQAGLLELADALDEGFDTRVGEAGRGLSGGEKQRVALARAFLKKPSLILFDEPTTGLDLRTEKLLQEAMQKLGGQATVITVAHRLHTIRAADLILFLDDGKLAASGTHEHLMKTFEPYRDMVRLQQGGVAG